MLFRSVDAIDSGFALAVSRRPTPEERQSILAHLKTCQECDPGNQGLEKLGWFLMNLDEFLFVQ